VALHDDFARNMAKYLLDSLQNTFAAPVALLIRTNLRAIVKDSDAELPPVSPNSALDAQLKCSAGGEVTATTPRVTHHGSGSVEARRQ
jgi:hypothetical protein